MFNAIREPEQQSYFIGRGMAISVLVHSVVITAVVYLSAKAASQLDPPTVTFIQAASPPPPPPPPPAAGQESTQKKKRKKPKKRVVPTKAPAEPQKTAVAEPEPGGQVGGVAGGVAGGVVGGKVGGTGSGSAVIPFGAGMQRPKLRSGPARPRYTKEARAARVEGTVIVRCTITKTGRVTNCKTIKPLAHMTKAVLRTLKQQRYSPVMFQGRAVSVKYTFPFRFKLR